MSTLKLTSVLGIITILSIFSSAQAASDAETQMDAINQTYLDDSRYQDQESYPDLSATLTAYKTQFMANDSDASVAIDLMELKTWMTALGQTKTPLELKKMIAEIDRENTGSISYNDFVFMRLSKQATTLKTILTFSEQMGQR